MSVTNKRIKLKRKAKIFQAHRDMIEYSSRTLVRIYKNKKLLIKKCSIKDVTYQPELIFEPKRIWEVNNHWITSLGYFTRDAPKFGKVILDLKKNLKL